MPIQRYERILLTGGTGFIGRFVLKSLISQGLRPLVVDRNVSRSDSGGSFDAVNLDLTDSAETERLIKDYGPELVIHLAGASLRDDPSGKYCDQMNFHATASLLEILARSGAQKAIILGSASEYGDSPVPFSEDMSLRPVSHYARSKANASMFANEFFRRTGFDVTVLRVFTAYGPGQPAKMFLSQLVRHAILNQNFNMSDGVQTRDFVFVEDVADAIIAASVPDRAAGRVVNIGSGRAFALNVVGTMVWKKCGADPEKLHIGAIGKAGDDPFDTLANIDLAAELLDWRPQTTFETGLDLTIDAMRMAVSAG